MARIIPWKLPDVAGGSEGGYTPAPTPEPENLYYDFTNVQVVRYRPEYNATDTHCIVKVSGIETVSLVGMSSMRHDGVAYQGGSQAAADAKTTQRTSYGTETNPLTLADINGNYTLGVRDGSGSKYWYSESLTFTVYDADGNILQQETLDLSGLNA